MNYCLSPGPFENPPDSRQGQRTPIKNDDHMFQTQQDDIDMLIDEELAMWPKPAGFVNCGYNLKNLYTDIPFGQ